MSERRGDWIQTYTGQTYWPIDPRAEEVDIRDIAHALSLICRFNGHCMRFYSVAEHSVHCYRAAVRDYPEHATWALLHDAAEAYLCDLPRPVKRSITGYKDLELLNEQAIAVKFGLPTPTVPPEVKLIDNRMLAIEAIELLSVPPIDWVGVGSPYTNINTKLGLMPWRAEAEFLAAAEACGLLK